MAEQDEMVQGSDARIYTTMPNEPEEGRVFVWAKARWYEREEGDSGVVEFPPIADSFSDLYQLVQQEPGADLTELDDDFAAMVREEFMAQDMLYPYEQDSERVDVVPRAVELDSDDLSDEEEDLSDLHLEDLTGAEVTPDEQGPDDLELAELAAEGRMGSGAFDDEQLDALEASDRPETVDIDEAAPSGRGRRAADLAAQERAPADVLTPDQGEGLREAADLAAEQEVEGPRPPTVPQGMQGVRGASPRDLATSEGTEPPPPPPPTERQRRAKR